jgi:hypothetical protein
MASAQNFSPKTVGSKWYYKMGEHSFTDELTDNSYKFKGKTYFTNLRTYSWNATETSYFRVDENGTSYYLDIKSKQESIDLPGQPKVGDSWISTDKAWKYSVTDRAAILKTPKQTFKDCLVIKAEQLTNRDQEKLQTYFNYYAKDIGFLGSTIDGELMAYIDQWDLK